MEYLKLKHDHFYFDTFIMDLEEVWRCLNYQYEVLFPKEELNNLWEEFSQELYCAGSLIPNYGLIDEFAHWLWLLKSNKLKGE